MAVILYANGLTEEYKSNDLTFSEEELINIFSEFPMIKTTRVSSLINTWCIYGNNENPDNYNKLASDIIDEPVYSHVLFVHDSEINPEWRATDSILYKGYEEFIISLKKIIDDVAINIVNEIEISQDLKGKADYLPQLNTIGATKDNKILFSYNPDDQTKEFYNNEEFNNFSQKVYNYIINNKQDKEPFTIYSDKHAIIIIESKKVNQFLNTLLENFKNKEEYEICTNITKMIKHWTNKTSKLEFKSLRNTSKSSKDSNKNKHE